MTTRIRYVATHESHILNSTRMYQVGDVHYSVALNTNSLQFIIANAGTKEQVASGQAPSIGTLKIKAKNALVSLGYTFDEESRTKGS